MLEPLKHVSAAVQHRMGVRTCSRCGMPKALGCFRWRAANGVWCSQCRVCERISRAEYRVTAEQRAYQAEYRRRPEVKAAIRRYEDGYYARRLMLQRAREATPRGRLIHSRAVANYRLRQTTDPARADRIRALIVAQDAEIARIDARRQADAD